MKKYILQGCSFPYADCVDVNSKTGFTLIELLVVVLIIGILAAVALPQYEKAVMKSRAGAVLSLTGSIYTAQQAYFLANNQYAIKFEDLDIGMPAGETSSNEGSLLTYSDGRKFNLCAACGSIQSYPTPHLPFYIEFYFDNRKMCWAGKHSERANDICKSISGSPTVVGGDSTNNGYLINF